MKSADDHAPQLGYLVVAGRRGPVATPAFFGVSADRYWIAARRSTAKVRHLTTCDRASLLMPFGDSWKLVTGHARVVDVLRPASLFGAVRDLAYAPAGLLDHVRTNGQSLLGMWAARPELLIHVATAFKVLICLHARPDGERWLDTPTGSNPLVVVATEVDSFPVAAMARRESRDVMRLSEGASAAILPHARTTLASITRVHGNPVDPDGSVAQGSVTRKSYTEITFRETSITRWSGATIKR